MNTKMLTASGLVMAALLFGAFNIVSSTVLSSARFDLTEHQLYTLSAGTKNVLKNLVEPITLRFYISKKLATGLPGIKGYATRVEEMLEEYQQVAGSHLVLQILDPEPFSEEEDRAVGFGLQGIPLDNGTTHFYFGLAGTSSTDDTEVIPFFQPEREEFLEYDLTKLVNSLAHPKKKMVGLMSTLPIDGGGGNPFMQQMGGGQPWLIVNQIEQVFELKKIEPTATVIPDDISVLMIVHPKSLTDATLYAIDQFVLGGGHALIFVDPLAEADRGGGNPMNPFGGGGGPRDSNMPKVFAAWGIELVPGKVLADLPLAKKVQVQPQGRLQVVDYPVWIDFRQDHFNHDDIVTAQIPTITVASAGILKKSSGGTTDIQPLIESDEAAMQIEASRLSFLPDPSGLLTGYKPDGEKMIVAARITGKVKTAFPEGKPPVEATDNNAAPTPSEEKASPKAHLAESKDSINVIVVADTDILQDRFWVQVQNFFGQRIGIPNAGNGTFVTNALDNLTGSNDLISVRSRAGYSRPFTLLRVLQQEADQQFRLKEQALQERLKATERKIQELQSQKSDGSNVMMSPEQQEALNQFRGELIQVRKELRGVQHELAKNIEGLESFVKFVNIGLVPLLIGVAGVWISAKRLRGRTKNG